MSPYPDLANPDLLVRIPLTARCVLDVGCGRGMLGAAYRRFNPSARLLGIESHPTAAAVARTRLDEVAAIDIQGGELPFDLPEGIDCIIYGDVLEHLVDPWTVIARHAEALSEQGMLLISVPNVEHWTFTARQLHGNWDYDDDGLFDRTHLRWFSLESMRRGLFARGLVPVDVTPRIYEPERGREFIAAMTPALEAMGIDTAAYASRAQALQYIWRVRRAQPRSLVVVSTMMEHVGGVSHVRIGNPMAALATDPEVHAQIVPHDVLPAVPADKPRIFIMHRPILNGEAAIGRLRTILAKGFLVVTEFDDHPGFFAPLRGPENLTFRGVHAVQTSTAALAGVIGAMNPEVAIFRNSIQALPDPANFTDPARLTLFFGGLNREADWSPVVSTLNTVARMAGERLGFRIVHDKGLFDALETPHKSFTPTCDYPTYMELLGQSEISFMPLVDNEFNRAKSDLKFIEAGACRVAAVASNVVYADTVRDGQTGLIFHTPEELGQALFRLVAQPELARALGDAARAYVKRERMLAEQVAARIAWYRDLWERREELTAALLQRAPELANG